MIANLIGANIRKIVTEAGGPSDGSGARMVKFPRPESSESVIKLEGKQALVDNIAAAIESFVKEREDQVAISVDVPATQHRLLIGRGGDTRRSIESQFNVTVDIPKQGSGRSELRLKGASSAVESAKAHILTMLQDQQGETVSVPVHLHHAVSDNGAIFRRLRNDYQVTVDHAGHQIPARPAPADNNRDLSGAPLITDDPSESIDDTHSWKVVNNDSAATSTETIPWILLGTTDNVSRAKTTVEKALTAASQQSATGYLILPDPKTYRFVVGQGGSQINAIRKATQCRVTVPKDQARGEAIEVRGSSAGVEQAKEMILDAVRGGLSR